MSVLPVVAALDLDGLIQAAVVVLFFLLPVLRQIFGDRSGSKAPRKDPRPRPGRRSSGGWDELLREFGVDLGGEPGETPRSTEPRSTPPADAPPREMSPSSTPPTRPPTPAPPPPATPPPSAATTVGTVGGGAAATPALGSFDTGLGSVIAVDELASVPSELDLDLADVPSELGDLASVPSEGGTSASGDLEDLLAAVRADVPAAAGASAFSAGLSMEAWRRAVVLSEVLGTPVALRGEDETLPGWR